MVPGARARSCCFRCRRWRRPPRLTARCPMSRFAMSFTVATLAPSVYNTQPWRFRTDGYVIDLFADRDRQLHYLDAPGTACSGCRCGAALHHLRLAIRGLGRDVEVRLLPDPDEPDHLARVIPGRQPTTPPPPKNGRCCRRFGSAARYRDTFVPKRLTRGLVVDLERAVAAEGCALRAVERPGERAGHRAPGRRRRCASSPPTSRHSRSSRAGAGGRTRWRPASSLADGIPRSAVARGTHGVGGSLPAARLRRRRQRRRRG